MALKYGGPLQAKRTFRRYLRDVNRRLKKGHCFFIHVRNLRCELNAGKHNSVPVADVLAGLQPVDRAAIRAARLAGAGHIQIDLGVAVPDLHVRLGTGAEDAALRVEVLGQQFHRCC